MAVREALLTLLGIEPTYGFRLHTELVRRLPHRAALNVGQTYSTIERATKAGLVADAGMNEDALPIYELTATGHAAVNAWLTGADGAGTAVDETRDRVLLMLSIAEMSPYPDSARTVIETERARWAERTLRGPETPAQNTLENAVDTLNVAQARAVVDWLDALANSDLSAYALNVADDRAKRGRPKRAPREATPKHASEHAGQAQRPPISEHT